MDGRSLICTNGQGQPSSCLQYALLLSLTRPSSGFIVQFILYVELMERRTCSADQL